MEILTEIINQYGVAILGTILTGLATYLGVYAKKLANKYINTKVKQDIARTVVQGVEQCYADLKGRDKLEKAMDAASAMLAEQGIIVTELELKMLLESAVGAFNNVFNDTPEIAGTVSTDSEIEQ